MQCSSCHLEHPNANLSYARSHMRSADPADQASRNVNQALNMTQNCAKAIANGFERFERQDKKINAIVMGKSYELCETNGLDNNVAMGIDAIRALIIQRMQATFGTTH